MQRSNLKLVRLSLVQEFRHCWRYPGITRIGSDEITKMEATECVLTELASTIGTRYLRTLLQ